MQRYSFWTNPVGWLLQDNREFNTPQSTGGGSDIVKPLDLTTVAGYLLIGGLVFYFGKKLVK